MVVVVVVVVVVVEVAVLVMTTMMRACVSEGKGVVVAVAFAVMVMHACLTTIEANPASAMRVAMLSSNNTSPSQLTPTNTLSANACTAAFDAGIFT
jgi:hypothetical protein